MLPELLKNNFFGDPTFSRAKSVDEIKEMWRRLKGAYGDTKTMLTKKLSEFQQFWEIMESRESSENYKRIVSNNKRYEGSTKATTQESHWKQAVQWRHNTKNLEVAWK